MTTERTLSARGDEEAEEELLLEPEELGAAGGEGARPGGRVVWRAEGKDLGFLRT